MRVDLIVPTSQTCLKMTLHGSQWAALLILLVACGWFPSTMKPFCLVSVFGATSPYTAWLLQNNPHLKSRSVWLRVLCVGTCALTVMSSLAWSIRLSKASVGSFSQGSMRLGPSEWRSRKCFGIALCEYIKLHKTKSMNICLTWEQDAHWDALQDSAHGFSGAERACSTADHLLHQQLHRLDGNRNTGTEHGHRLVVLLLCISNPLRHWCRKDWALMARQM